MVHAPNSMATIRHINISTKISSKKNENSSLYTWKHTTVVLNNDRLVGRVFDDATTFGSCCKELARRLGGGCGLDVSHVARAADV